MRGQPRELVTVREADQYEGHNVPALTVKNGVTSPGGEQPGFLIQILQKPKERCRVNHCRVPQVPQHKGNSILTSFAQKPAD